MNRPLSLLLSILFCGHLCAQEPAPPDEHAADRAALRELAGRYEEAINNGDLHPLEPSVAPTVSAVFATNHEVHGLDGIQKYFDSVQEMMGKGSSYTVKLEPDRTEFFGDIAIGHGKSAEVATWGDGREYRFDTKWTVVLKKEADGWKALRLQVTMDPFDNPVITTRLLARTWVLLALGVIAAGIAFFVGRGFRKRRRSAS